MKIKVGPDFASSMPAMTVVGVVVISNKRPAMKPQCPRCMSLWPKPWPIWGRMGQ